MHRNYVTDWQDTDAVNAEIYHHTHLIIAAEGWWKNPENEHKSLDYTLYEKSEEIYLAHWSQTF